MTFLQDASLLEAVPSTASDHSMVSLQPAASMKPQPVRDWPEAERPRERLLRQGAQVLSDAELLAIFLRTGTQQHSVVSLARLLLDRFQGLAGLLQAPPEAVMGMHGMGMAKYTHLMAALELGRRHTESQLQAGLGLSDPALVKQYLALQLRPEKREVFAVLFLDSQLKLLAFERLFFGSLTACKVYLREVLSRALAHHAVQLIVAHNHPDAPAVASRADLHLTSELQTACDMLDIQLVDHIIVGTDGAISLAELGQMP